MYIIDFVARGSNLWREKRPFSKLEERNRCPTKTENSPSFRACVKRNTVISAQPNSSTLLFRRNEIINRESSNIKKQRIVAGHYSMFHGNSQYDDNKLCMEIRRLTIAVEIYTILNSNISFSRANFIIQVLCLHMVKHQNAGHKFSKVTHSASLCAEMTPTRTNSKTMSFMHRKNERSFTCNRMRHALHQTA